ncbi:hypothetical protein [Allomesorhizobium camelthorni]|uniref:Uncharacterized protein n=1 Tax=Allomesorhizobium camelthorni TaxID=475069 RepID=A0A6G4WBX0_9HYPH|nr:hypothetical protein [Mesorhizobium camelthorni]NGO51617.1 hypothetical protein [Mesorhizobium camelthorni]
MSKIPKQRQGGTAVGDEDPDDSPMDGRHMPTGPAQPFDVDHLESEKRKPGEKPAIAPKKGG